MRIAIFGATGKTGQELIKQAVKGGHSVTAFARDASKVAEQASAIRVVAGDVTDPAKVAECVRDQDAVICALGSRDLRKTTIRTTGTMNIIAAMKEQGVKRFVVMSAMGVGESWKALSLINKLFFVLLLPAARADHEAQEAAVKASDLAWTIVRPSGLTDTPRTGTYLTGEDIRAKTSQIPRGDVADLMLKALQSPSLVRKAVTITN